MAIPFSLPTDQETQENYRQLDQLLRDLYEIIRLIIIRQRSPGEATENAGGDTVSGGNTDGANNAGELGNDGNAEVVVVEEAPRRAVKPVPPPRRKRRRPPPPPPPDTALRPRTASSAWLNVGIELRQIAEEFRTNNQLGEVRAEKRRMEVKASSLFSLLVPASVTGSIWTTVVLIVGWKLLTRHNR